MPHVDPPHWGDGRLADRPGCHGCTRAFAGARRRRSDRGAGSTHRPRRAERRGQDDAAAARSPAGWRSRPVPSSRRRPTRWSGCSRRSRNARRTRRCAPSSLDARASPTSTAELDVGHRRARRGGGGQRRRATAPRFDQWLALGARRPRRPRRRRVGRPRPGAGVARPADERRSRAARRRGPRSPSLLLSRFDVFLLDEPTNDLDLDGLARLERWVIGLRAGVVVVSHDRTFLERTVTDVVEIDEFTHTGDAASAAAGRRTSPSASCGPATRAGALRGVRHEAPHAARAGPARAGVGQPGPGQGHEDAGRDRQEHPAFQDQPDRAARRQGGAHRAGDRAPRGGRQAARAVAAAPRHRRSPGAAATSSLRARRRGRRPGRLPARTGRPAARARRAGGPRRRERRGQVDACSTCCSGGSARIGGRPGSGPGVVVGEIEQARNQLRGRRRRCSRSFMAATGLNVPRRPDAAGQVRPRGRSRRPRRRRTLSPGERTAGVARRC